MTHDEIIAVVQGHRDGKAVQCWSAKDQVWFDWIDPVLDRLIISLASRMFRVKPEPRRGFVPDICTFETLQQAKAMFPHAECIEFVEVVK